MQHAPNALATNAPTSAGPPGSLLQGLRDGFRFHPFAFIAILFYVSLRSSTLRDPLVYHYNPDFYSAFVNIGDYVLAAGLTLTFAMRGIRLSRGMLYWLAISLSMILASFLNSGQQGLALRDALIFWLRFSAVFVFTYSLCCDVGEGAAESLLYLVFAVLAASSIVVSLVLPGGGTDRLYSAGMYVSSFGQLAATTSIVALASRRYLVFAVSLTFLILTFSISTWAVFVLLASSIVLFEGGRSKRAKARVLIIILGLGVLIITIVNHNSVRRNDVQRHLDFSKFNTMHGRTDIWKFAIAKIGKDFRVFGHGYNTSPAGLQDMYLLEDYGWKHVENFHSVAFELLWGIGIGSIVVYLFVFWRVLRACSLRCYPAFSLYVLFLVSQSIDYSFFGPKEMIVFGLCLGLAEGLLQRAQALRIAALTLLPLEPLERHLVAGRVW